MSTSKNNLFPVFLKLNELRTLIIGGGYVGHEKLTALLKNDPDARVRLLAREISSEVILVAAQYRHVELIEKPFEDSDIDDSVDLVLVATDDEETNRHIRNIAKSKNRLVNVADTPHLCDFYLGSTVGKGQLKIGISTNGTSPTFAKRFREVLEEILPDETNELLRNLKLIRDDLKGNFAEKVTKLNEITESLVEKSHKEI